MQLKFNNEFNDIIENVNNYKKIEELNIKEYVEKIINQIYLYDIDKEEYSCIKCNSILKNGVCKNCNKKYNIKNEIYKVYSYELYDDYILNFCIYYFDIQDALLLYKFEIDYNINNQNYEITITNVYQITNLGLYDLVNDVYKSFKEYEKEYVTNKTYIIDNHTYLYKDNLDILKTNYLYKYTLLWEFKYIENININLLSLALYPIYYKQFEYLMKMGLYNLAINNPYDYVHKNFKDNFGLDKKYYEFMKEINITKEELEILKIIKEPNKELIDYYSDNSYLAIELSRYVKLDKLKKYLESQNLSSESLYEYRDYISYLEKLSLDLTDKDNLFPKNLLEEHDKLELQIELAENKDINDKITSLSNILKINTYEDDKYVIYSANNIESLIDESRQMHNCVRTYIESVGENKCQIYFMRHKKSVNESFVTIEVKDNSIVQARCKYNKLPDDKIKEVLKKWERTLIPICNEEIEYEFI